MIFCRELNKEFADKSEMFKELASNITEIIDLKKIEQKSCDKGSTVTCKVLNGIKTDKSVKSDFEIDDDYYYIAVNTTYILDSHEDLHVDNIWAKTVQEKQGRNYLVADHQLTIDSTIVRKAHVEMFIAELSFAALKMPYEGTTQALVYKFRKDKVIHDKAKEWLDSGDDIEASVRMKYINIEFAMDSDDAEYAKQKKVYDTYYPRIANKDDFEYIPYFFVIKEASNERESSLVIAGSNHVTGKINKEKEIEPEDSTHINTNKIDPTEVSQKLKSSLLLT